MTDRKDALTDLPIPALTDDLTDRISKEVAALVSDHIEFMYPRAAEVVAWNSARRSIQGVVRNAVKGAGDAAERGQADQWIKRSEKSRRDYRATVKRLNAAFPAIKED